MYWRLPPFADAVVTVAPRESDGLLVARIAKGRARKPRCCRDCAASPTSHRRFDGRASSKGG